MGNKKKKDLSLKGESNDLDYQYPEGAEVEEIKMPTFAPAAPGKYMKNIKKISREKGLYDES
jgi:hypothetical protein